MINVTIDGFSVSLCMHILYVCGIIAAVEAMAAKKPIAIVGVSISTVTKTSTLIYSIRQSSSRRGQIDHLGESSSER